MLLFKSNTHFQLMNAINIKLKLYPNDEADLFLDDATDFETVIPKLKELYIFRRVELLHINDTILDYVSRDMEGRKEFFSNLMKNFAFNITSDYTDCYFGLDNVSNKFFYYYLVNLGQAPKVHIYEEGTTSFVRDVRASGKGDGIDHYSYGERSFLLNVEEQLFYNPNICGIELPPYPLTKAPDFDLANSDIFIKLYGKLDMPKEKYIFFEEALLKEKYPSNDVDLIDFIADIVGKENIIIKMHPRNVIDRFSFRGYKVMANSNVPWEIALMSNDISDKVFISVFSTSSITAKYIFGKKECAVHLSELFIGKYPLLDNSNFPAFKSRLYAEYNTTEETNFYCPNSEEEFREMLIYFNGGMN